MFRHAVVASMLALTPYVATATTVDLMDTGGGQGINVAQASMALHGYVQVGGVFNDIGTIRWHAGINALESDSTFIKAEGQTLNINDYSAAYSVFGTTYGGDGRTTFRLPDLSGRAIKGTSDAGQVGAVTGQAYDVTTPLRVENLPSHTHQFNGEASSATGGGQAFSIEQESIALRYDITTQGIFPGGLLPGQTYAEVEMSARVLEDIPEQRNSSPADGSLVPIGSNTALFSLLGTTHGGDGRTTFGLPDIDGRIVVHEGQGPGRPNRTLGEKSGADTATLSVANLPSHGHALDASESTENTGSGTEFSIRQPEIALNWIIALNGIFPSRAGALANEGEPVLGQMTMFAGNPFGDTLRGWALADGQLLAISQYQALFALLGTTYGGDGRTTFALPDMRGRTVVGTGGNLRIGDTFGSDRMALSVATMPSHSHTIEQTSPVPLPAGLPLLLAGLGALVWVRRRTA